MAKELETSKSVDPQATTGETVSAKTGSSMRLFRVEEKIKHGLLTPVMEVEAIDENHAFDQFNSVNASVGGTTKPEVTITAL
jgi:hypothetical protein